MDTWRVLKKLGLISNRYYGSYHDSFAGDGTETRSQTDVSNNVVCLFSRSTIIGLDARDVNPFIEIWRT